MTAPYNQRNTSGFIFLATLFMALLITALALFTYESALTISSAQATKAHSTHAKLEASSSVIKSLESGPLPIELPACTSSKALHGRVDIARVLCVRPRSNSAPEALLIGRELSDPLRFPLIDYNQIFHNPDSCMSVIAAGTQTLSGFVLSPSAFITAQSCELNSQSEIESFSVRMNLEVSRSARLRANTDSPALLAALGYLNTSDELNVEADAIILAGGDLHIHSLKTAAKSRVSLISASGYVAVDSVQGEAEFAIFAWSGISIPSIPALQTKLLLPDQVVLEPLGFIQTTE